MGSRVTWEALIGFLLLVGLKLVARPVRVTPGHRFLYKGVHIQGQDNKFFEEQGSHLNFLLFVTARGLFPLHRKSIAAA